MEDVVSVTCEAGHFTVDIDLSFLKRLYPVSSEATIALADPSCLGTIISVGGQDRLVITSETDSCGTQIVVSGVKMLLLVVVVVGVVVVVVEVVVMVMVVMVVVVMVVLMVVVVMMMMVVLVA